MLLHYLIESVGGGGSVLLYYRIESVGGGGRGSVNNMVMVHTVDEGLLGMDEVFKENG